MESVWLYNGWASKHSPPVSQRDAALVAVAQAGRGRVAAGRYVWRRMTWSPESDPVIIGWEALIESLNSLDDDALIAGEIDSAARTLIASSPKPIRIAPPALCIRRAAVLADLALARFGSDAEFSTDPATVTPIYVNQPGVPHP